MYHNASLPMPAMVATTGLPSSHASAIELSPVPKSLSPNGRYAVPFSPAMRSKSARSMTRVGPPDFAGMRERRAHSDMTVSQLQLRRGVVRTEEARPSSGWTRAITSMGAQAWQTLTEAFSMEVGPRGAAAAPLIANARTLSEFQQKFSNDFEIWVSPAAQGAADMKGMLIVIGEDHYDEDIAKSIKQIMGGFRRGDRFFKEGGTYEGCREREAMYGLRKGACQLLEKGAFAVSQLNAELEDLLVKLEACVDYLRKHVPAAVKENLLAMNIGYYDSFIKRHASNLPPAAAAGLKPLFLASEAKFDEFEANVVKHQSARDQHMANKLRASRYSSGLNYAIVGATHLQGIRTHLRDLPCVFMLPKSLLGDSSITSLLDSSRDEL